MARRPNTRPTSIYWLVDIRTETLVNWPRGLPFYCGKTVLKPKQRFDKHRSDARRCPNTDIARRLDLCGDYVRIQIMEVVSPTDDWAEREKFWIYTIRLLYPDVANVTSGGNGMAGFIPSSETKAKRSASLKGRIFSAEHRAKIGFASANRSPDVYLRIGESQKGRTASAETRAKLSAAGKGKKKPPRSAEYRAKMSEARKGNVRSLESRMKQSETMKRVCFFSDEHRARISAALRGRKRTPEHIAALVASRQKGKHAKSV